MFLSFLLQMPNLMVLNRRGDGAGKNQRSEMNFFKTCMKLMQLGDFTLAGVVSWFSPSSGSEIDTSNIWKIYFFKISAF